VRAIFLNLAALAADKQPLPINLSHPIAHISQDIDGQHTNPWEANKDLSVQQFLERVLECMDAIAPERKQGNNWAQSVIFQVCSPIRSPV
jgi:hypothetical protein